MELTVSGAQSWVLEKLHRHTPRGHRRLGGAGLGKSWLGWGQLPPAKIAIGSVPYFVQHV